MDLDSNYLGLPTSKIYNWSPINFKGEMKNMTPLMFEDVKPYYKTIYMQNTHPKHISKSSITKRNRKRTFELNIWNNLLHSLLESKFKYQ
jgi:hypothetical protein